MLVLVDKVMNLANDAPIYRTQTVVGQFSVDVAGRLWWRKNGFLDTTRFGCG